MRARAVVARTLTVLGAWLPFFLFWVLFFLSYAGQKLSTALWSGVVAIGSAAILGIEVWRFCAGQPWPLKVRPVFYAKHFAAASAYALLWLAAMNWAESFLRGMPFWDHMAQVVMSRVVGWQFLMGLWLYGLVAGVSYSIQIRERANASERRALRAEAALVEARLEALRSRLNPHFLFNALHTVGALVRQDAARAENAVEKLGDLLRHTLREDPGETVPFREEWDFTQRYLEFEQLRYEERLAVSRDIDPRSLDCSVPSFALQTLVENAVRHSIANRVEGGRVEISAAVDGTTLLLRVRDDGSGPRVSDGDRPGYGLRALKERLEAVYGDAAALEIHADSGAGCEVSIKLPCQPQPRDDADDS
jgi:signal transduction histidine kinase